MALNGSNMMYTSKARWVLQRGSKETAITVTWAEQWDFHLSFLPEKGMVERLAGQVQEGRLIHQISQKV